MEKLKVYIDKHHKSTAERLKQKVLKSRPTFKQLTLDQIHSQNQLIKCYFEKNERIKANSQLQKQSKQQSLNVKKQIKNILKQAKSCGRYQSYDTSNHQSQKTNLVKRDQKIVKSQANLRYYSQSNKQVENKKRNKSQKRLNHSLTKSYQDIIKPSNQMRISLQQNVQKVRKIKQLSLPSKKRSKSAHTKEKPKNDEKQQCFLDEDTSKNQQTTLKFSTKAFTKQGIQIMNPNKVNQDRYIIEENKNILKNKSISIYAVADGHGPNGHFVSQLAIQNLPKKIQEYMKQNKSVKYSLQRAYGDIQKTLLQTNKFNADFSGSTMVTIVVENMSKLTCANTGDSRAIAVRQLNKDNWEVLRLSNDHKPNRVEERQRIINCGGRIDTIYDQNGKKIGPLRVWLPKKQVQGLAMTRSLGDNISKPIGVTHEPQILSHDLSSQDKFILVASDGVWQFLTNYQILCLIIPFYKQNQIQEACQALFRQAYKSWTVEDDSIVDDITFILIFIGKQNGHGVSVCKRSLRQSTNEEEKKHHKSLNCPKDLEIFDISCYQKK